MTVKQLTELYENPKNFLSRCKYHETEIKLKQGQIQHYKAIAYSITAAIKDTPVFGNTVAKKVENCAVSIIDLENDIAKEIEAIRQERLLACEAINLIDAKDLRQILEARYINGFNWEEVAVLLHYSYRWTLRLHGKALTTLSSKAKEKLIHIKSH